LQILLSVSALEELTAVQATQLANAASYIQQFGAVLTRQQQAETLAGIQAHLEAMPDDKTRINKLLELMMTTSSPAPQTPLRQEPNQETPQQRKVRMTREILADVNEEFGLTGDNIIIGNEDDIDGSNPQAFRSTVRLLAKMKQKQKEATVPPRKQTAAEPPKGGVKAEEIAEDIYSRVMSDLGIGRSNSARPAGGGGKLGEDEIQAQIRKINTDPTLGPVAKVKRIRELRSSQSR